MRKFLLIIAAMLSLFANTTVAQTVPIEKGAVITDTDSNPRHMMLNMADPAVNMIRAHGWRCDSISAMSMFLFSRGFSVSCNKFRYKYELSDKGGNWVVELK